ncbi:MAG: hypothetical protein Q8L34_05510 [Candidatus Woesearchaeota archaeon]|nr:hypothetical protein [Candidatus Woesearchaeota archaeon]
MISLQRLLYWIFLLFLLYLIFELARKLLGGSLGFEELVIGLLVANLGYSYHINTKFSEHLGWHRGKENSS